MDRLDSYVDRELSESELAEVLLHLGHCPPCQEIFRLRADMKRLIKLCCDEAKAGTKLRERVRQLLF
ncbi:MAG: zf-HC2 domain-containing protein [Candidatus Dormibacteraceae bacterium]